MGKMFIKAVLRGRQEEGLQFPISFEHGARLVIPFSKMLTPPFFSASKAFHELWNCSQKEPFLRLSEAANYSDDDKQGAIIGCVVRALVFTEAAITVVMSSLHGAHSV